MVDFYVLKEYNFVENVHIMAKKIGVIRRYCVIKEGGRMMKCPNCNNEIDDKSIFCTYCGVKVEKDDSNEITETVSDSNETVNEAAGEQEKEDKTDTDAVDISEIKDSGLQNESVNESAVTVEKKKFNLKFAVAAAVIFVVVAGGCIFGYTKYMNTVLSNKAYSRDYSLIGSGTIAFNYTENIGKGELYSVKNGKGTKIADNVKAGIYNANPVKDFVIYQTNEGTGGKTYIYNNGENKEFSGEFYKYTEDGKYMLYTNDNDLNIYDCDTGMTKKIAAAEGDKSEWICKYDGKNKVVYVLMGDKKRLYKVDMNSEEEGESIESNVESFNIFGLNAYGYKKAESSDYEIKTQNSEESISLDFMNINKIEASVDGETILFTATRDESPESAAVDMGDIIRDERGTEVRGENEYALYAMVEGNEEPIKLLSGPVHDFEYKEDVNKTYVFKEDSVYSIDMPVRTRKNVKDKELYYSALDECEAVKIESDVNEFMVSPDGNTLIAVKNGVSSDSETTTTEATTAESNDGEPKGAFLSVVYAEETTQAPTENATENAASSNATSSVTNTTEAVTETATETTTEERIVGDTVELAVIRGDENKSVDVSASEALLHQYLNVSNDSVVYPLAVNGKVELHIIKDIDRGIDDLDKKDEVLSSNAGLFNFDNVKSEFVYFDKDAKAIVNYTDHKKVNGDKAVDYDLVYVNAGEGFDGYTLAYKKIPDYSTLVGKYKMTGDEVLNNIIIEFTSDHAVNVYSIGEKQGTCKFKINENESNKTSLRVSPELSKSYSPKCNPYYDHSTYTYELQQCNIMNENSLLIHDFDGAYKYKVSNDKTVTLEKLSDEDFNSAIAAQKNTHDNNVAQLNSEKAAAEAAKREQERRDSLDDLAFDYYIYGTYVTSYETLYSWHGYDYSTTYHYNNSHYADVYDYYVDYETGDIWLNTGGNPLDAWVVR